MVAVAVAVIIVVRRSGGPGKLSEDLPSESKELTLTLSAKAWKGYYTEQNNIYMVAEV